MSDAQEKVVLGEQAQAAWGQFIGPTVELLRTDYMAKLVDYAARPLDERSTQAIRNLSMATRVLAEVESQLRKVMADGEAAKREIGRAEKLANMSGEARRYAGY